VLFRSMQELTREMSEMRVSVEALEKERDFYFGKVSEVKRACLLFVRVDV